jgi:hypothetical protein
MGHTRTDISSPKLNNLPPNQDPAFSLSPPPFFHVRICGRSILLVLLFTAATLDAQYLPNSPTTKETPANTTSQSQKAPTPLAQGVQPNTLDNPNNCDLNQRPPINALVGPTRRRKIEGDYIVLEYNANPKSLQTRWYDYRQWYFNGTNPQWKYIYPIQRNGSFLPVVYAKEKILVHVCGLKFTDILTVTNSSTGLPEGGADIRGTVVTAVPTLTPALDSLQTIGATGGATSIGGVGFSATPALTSTVVTGVAAGTVSRAPSGLSYNDGNITASPAQLAQMMYAVKRNGVALIENIDDNYDDNYNVNFLGGIRTQDDFNGYTPNHIQHLTKEAQSRLNQVKNNAKDPIFKSDPAHFDQDMTNVQNLASELTSFFNVIASQGFGARALTLQNNYAVLSGPLDIIKRGADCIVSPVEQAAVKAANAQIAADVADAVLKKIPAGQVNERTAAKNDFDTKTAAAKSAENDLLQAEKTVATAPAQPSPDTHCDPWEQANNKAFQEQYQNILTTLIDSDPKVSRRAKVRDWTPSASFDDLEGLKGDIQTITTTTGQLFNEINDWNDASSVEQTDFITPIASNGLERISIVVQHGYVPFTLTTYSTSTAPAATAVTIPTTTTAASTSTPAHAVKTILVEVHRRANFNLIGGAMVLRVPTSTYAVQAGTSPAILATTASQPTLAGSTTTTSGMPPNTTTTTTYTYNYSFTQTYSGICNNTPGTVATYTAYATATNTTGIAPTVPPNPPSAPTPPAYSCVIQTQTSKTQLAGMVGMAWFPLGRDYFPRRNGFSIYPHDLIPSLFAATSVTSLGNAAFGFNFEPISGIGLFIGRGMAHTTILPNGVTTSTVLPSGYILPTITQVKWGYSYGIGLDLSVFLQLFTKGGSSAALP